jgi:hypothetical protein
VPQKDIALLILLIHNTRYLYKKIKIKEMALQQDYINELGQTIPDCYWKIGVVDGIIGGKYNFKGKLYCYENKTQADSNENELSMYDFDFVLNMGTPSDILEQAYSAVKEYEPFEDAIDV